MLVIVCNYNSYRKGARVGPSKTEILLNLLLCNMEVDKCFVLYMNQRWTTLWQNVPFYVRL